MFRRAFTALAFAALLALSAAPAAAQSNGAPKAQIKDAAPGATQASAPVRYEIEIEHGDLRTDSKTLRPHNMATLDNIVKLLREEHPEANIVMAPELADVRVEDLKLHEASYLREDLEALRVASGDKFIWKARQLSSIGVGEPLYSLESSERFLKEQAPAKSPQVEVFNFTSYFDRFRRSESARLTNSGPLDEGAVRQLEQITIDKTKDIIRETVQSFGGNSKMNFQFHQGANLLVVTGPTDEIDVAKKVINAMIEEPAGDPNLDGKQARDNSVKSQIQNHEVAVQLGSLGAENALLKARIEALEKALAGFKPAP